MSYTLTPEDNAVMRDSDGAIIPYDQNNPDYCRYQEWLQAGGVPNPAPTQAPLQ